MAPRACAFIVFLLVAEVSTQTDARTGAVRLTGDRLPFEGRVEIAASDQWWLVCSEGWDIRDADVVCRQIGHNMGAMLASARISQNPDDDNIGYLVKDVDCYGDENSISGCGRSNIAAGDCARNSDEASVTCNAPGYMGCYHANSPSFPADAPKLITDDMTIERCLRFCRDSEHILSGLRRSRECYCSSDVTGLVSARAENWFCNSTCVANGYQACGGYDYYSVYDTRYGSCGQIATTSPDGATPENGTIVSPGFPGDYPADSECQWLVRANGNKIIRLHFIVFEMNRDASDWLEIRDGSSEGSPLLARITGNTYGNGVLPYPVDSTSSAVLLIFVSDGAIDGRGFVINYEAIASPHSAGALSTGAIVGIVVCILAIMVVIFIILFITIRKKRVKENKNADHKTEGEPTILTEVPCDVILSSDSPNNETRLTRIPSYPTRERHNAEDKIVGYEECGARPRDGERDDETSTEETSFLEHGSNAQGRGPDPLPEYAKVNKNRRRHVDSGDEAVREPITAGEESVRPDSDPQREPPPGAADSPPEYGADRGRHDDGGDDGPPSHESSTAEEERVRTDTDEDASSESSETEEQMVDNILYEKSVTLV